MFMFYTFKCVHRLSSLFQSAEIIKHAWSVMQEDTSLGWVTIFEASVNNISISKMT